MIVFLCGPDDFRRLAKRKFVIKEFQKKHPRGMLTVFSGEEATAEKLNSFLRQESLFEEKKLGLIQDVELYPELVKIWKEISKNKNTTLIAESRKIPPKSSPLSKTEVAREEFPALAGREWKSFILKQTREAGAKLSSEAVGFLSESYEGDSWGVVTEIRKLASLSKEISAKDLATFGLGAAPEYWPMLNGLKSFYTKDRLRALALLNAENEPAAKTFNILASSWSEKTPQFAEYDASIKSGKLEYEEALLGAVL
jgi:DNA polymerase III delta subunit